MGRRNRKGRRQNWDDDSETRVLNLRGSSSRSERIEPPDGEGVDSTDPDDDSASYEGEVGVGQWIDEAFDPVEALTRELAEREALGPADESECSLPWREDEYDYS